MANNSGVAFSLLFRIESVMKLKLKNVIFHYNKIMLNRHVKQNILLKPISVSKSSMSVSSNSIARFLKFAPKIRKQKVKSNWYM